MSKPRKKHSPLLMQNITNALIINSLKLDSIGTRMASYACDTIDRLVTPDKCNSSNVKEKTDD
jgi:hypothetical protein